ncbi:MAG: c-type cytochrome domain-containing protein [Nitrososphaerales archaeon]
METYDDMMKGGEHGQAINPGDATGSLLIKQIQSGKMPKRGQKLPEDQIDLIAKWVTEGAKNN